MISSIDTANCLFLNLFLEDYPEDCHDIILEALESYFEDLLEAAEEEDIDIRELEFNSDELAENLTDEMLEEEAIKKLDGKLFYMSGDEFYSIFNEVLDA